MADNTQNDSRRTDGERQEKPSDAGIVSDMGGAENDSGYGDGNPRPESLDELALEESAEEEFLEERCADATEQNEDGPSGGTQTCHGIQRVIRVARRSENVDERHEHERGDTTRHYRPHEADQKIDPAKREPEIGPYRAGAIA